jgi:hypothetical protein
MGMTLLDDNIKSLIVNFDDDTCEAGFILRELSRNAFGARPLDRVKMTEALEKVCAEAKPIALEVIYAIECITANN